MAHLPVNHPAQPAYRALTAVIGLYILVFGIVGTIETAGRSFFDDSDTWVLGLRTNPAFSILSIITGAIILGGASYGRNADHLINLAASVVFLVAGIVMMTLLRTDANLLNFAMANCIVSFLIGIALLLGGLYGKVGTGQMEAAEDRFRHGETGGGTGGETARETGGETARETGGGTGEPPGPQRTG